MTINTKNFVISVIAVFIFMFAYDWLVHSQLLMPLYMETPNLWRPDAEMQALFPWSIGIDLAKAALIAYLFTQHYEARGMGEGVRFGLYIGALLGLMQLAAYTYLPVSLNLGLAWFFVYLLQGLGAGLILSLTYRR